MAKNKNQAENPTSFTGLKTTKPAKEAAGLKAVNKSLKILAKEVGLIKGLSVLNQLNQKGGVDCPGCAWPDPDDERSKLGEYCENGVKAIAEEISSKSLDASFFAQHSVQELSNLTDYEIGKKGRIAQPMYLAENASHYEAISWDKAFEKIASKLSDLASPNEAIFYTSGRTSNEAAFLYQLFVRAYGTNNLPDCSNMCHESSGKALSQTLGIGKGSVTLHDFEKAEVILILGQNPGTNHPRMLNALQKAKRNGAIIITVNPLREAGLVAYNNPQELGTVLGSKTQLSDHYLQIRINSDMALIQAINIILSEHEKESPGHVFDQTFIDDKTEGFTAYLKHLESLSLDKLIDQTGIARGIIETIAQILASKKRIIACWAMGLTQHKNSVDTIKEVVNLLLLKGSIGKEGAGTCPVRGHSNVQGDRTMGIHEAPSDKLLDSIQEVFNFAPPRHHGFDVVNAIKAMHDHRAKVFFAMGGNFLSATPDTLYTAKALAACDLTVQVSTKLNRSHLIHGKEAIILPCLARTDKDVKQGVEQFVSVENSMGIVHSSKGNLPPISDALKSEVDIVCSLAQRCDLAVDIPWTDYANNYDLVRDKIEATIAGFDNYNDRVRQPAGFYLPNGARNNEYNTSSKKAQFSISFFEAIPLKGSEFLMMTIRSHDQFNTTIYGLDDRYRGIYNERRVIMMNPSDMKAANLNHMDVVDLYNYTGGQKRVAKNFMVVSYDIPSRCVATYFPEANVLVPISNVAKVSNTPASKSVVIEVKLA